MTNETSTLTKKDTATQLHDLLYARSKSIQALLGGQQAAAEKMMKVAVNCVAKTPGLQTCTPTSLLRSVMAAAELNLTPGGALGKFYLVPFGTECTPIIGYKGFEELVRRSGLVSTIRAVIVYEKDEFRVTEGLEPNIIHERHLKGDPGQMAYVYTVVKMKDGTSTFEVMSKAQVDKVRAISRSKDNGPWVTWYDEQARKTCFRRHAKWLPLSEVDNSLDRAFELDNEDYTEGDASPVAAEVTSVKDRVKKKAQEAEVSPEESAQAEEVKS